VAGSSVRSRLAGGGAAASGGGAAASGGSGRFFSGSVAGSSVRSRLVGGSAPSKSSLRLIGAAARATYAAPTASSGSGVGAALAATPPGALLCCDAAASAPDARQQPRATPQARCTGMLHITPALHTPQRLCHQASGSSAQGVLITVVEVLHPPLSGVGGHRLAYAARESCSPAGAAGVPAGTWPRCRPCQWIQSRPCTSS